MNISAPKENYIFIELTNEDMKQLNITYADMDYSNIETRRVIWTLLDEARHSLGKDFELSDDLRIEALPSADGGCLLFFTITQKPLCYKVKSKTVFLAYRFLKIDDAFDLSALISDRDKERIKSSLYSYSGQYLLTVTGEVRHSVLMKLTEFAQPLAHGEKELMKLTEYEKCLIRDRALETLGGFAS
ncbi:MAG: adaptor protein MecA [Acutalibacteraceae bacterium]|nr:adaptor protein MecA [Oscillospiraceae bacterium]